MENKTKEFVLDQTTIKKLLTAYKLTIPDFQRSFVWKSNKKYQLISSLFKGFPIGALTLYEDKGQYYIIDGLQRINTLQQYLSSPSEIVGFKEYYSKISEDIKGFITKNDLGIRESQLKSCIKGWYEGLNGLYQYEKMTVLYNKIKAKQDIFKYLNDLDLIAELFDILQQNIRIMHDDIVLIIYKGDKEDLPELFKNINTGSVALSQYEILQSVWINYYLDETILVNEYDAFLRELELIKEDYEIGAAKDKGQFDIFKNLIGLNNIICCIKDSEQVFNYSAYKKRAQYVVYPDNNKKYYDNDTISFELYSSIISLSSNRIVKAVDILYSDDHTKDEISMFVKRLNEIIVETINELISYLSGTDIKLIESKYHSLYIITGLIMSKYDIDAYNLKITSIGEIDKIKKECLDIERHIKEKWFLDENRQISFFAKKLLELNDMKH
ncbi:MAG: DUF262 domain-containing protein [Lachnospira pectinoschiza]|uniref:DUF262 domain-containing protein n=1 Tax=[Lactobacillus] rogosae TaxID=706562 RepID=UPI003A314922